MEMTKLNVWIFQTGEPLHSDLGDIRGMRAMNLANALIELGHNVTIWSSSFFHQEKNHRSKIFKEYRLSESLCIKLIPSPGYQTNIGLDRLWDHAILAKNLRLELSKTVSRPDVAFVGYPPIEFAFVAVKWLKFRKVPIMVDVKDQWPHIFIEPFPKLLKPLIRILLLPYYYMGFRVLRESDAHCTMAQGFLDWIVKFSGKNHTSNDCIIPLTTPIIHYNQDNIIKANEWWSQKGVLNDGRCRFFFIGSITQSFNFIPIYLAAKQALIEDKDWQFVICGNGEKINDLKELFNGMNNIVMAGWIDRSQIYALSLISNAGLAPYKNTSNFINNIPNKVIDYFSMGKPVICPLKGEIEALINDYNVGLTYQENNNDLYYKIVEFISNPCEMDNMSFNSFNLYKSKFSADKIYKELVFKLQILAKNTKD